MLMIVGIEIVSPLFELVPAGIRLAQYFGAFSNVVPSSESETKYIEYDCGVGTGSAGSIVSVTNSAHVYNGNDSVHENPSLPVVVAAH